MLPIIDFSEFSTDDAARRQEIAAEISTACETDGFLNLNNHGIRQSVIDAAFSAVESYFAQPEAEKWSQCREPGHYRGYIPTTTFSTDDNGGPSVSYEAFIVGAEVEPGDPSIADSNGIRWPTPWPAEPADFRPALTAYWDAVTVVAEDLVRVLALALGLPEETFASRFIQPISNMSLLHYLPNPDGIRNTREHFDTNALTILMPSPAGGLEVLHCDGRWIEVPPLDGCFVVNVANQMECWSGGRFISTKHRVKPPAGIDRYSMAYFAMPDYGTVVEPLAVDAPDSSRFKPIHVGQDMANFVSQFDD
jgi:isopenicillin N synthase-like dioxygenase